MLATVALAMVAEATGTDTFGEGLALGLVAGIGTTAGYHVLGLVAAVILALWT